MSTIAHVILGALSLGPKSGYEIKQLVDKTTRFFWAASYGQIYPELKRLEAQGLIEGAESANGGRRRVVFALTAAGRNALRAWLLEPDAGYELRDEGLMKLFFADALSPADRLELLRRFRAERQDVLDRLREIERAVGSERIGTRALVLEYGIGHHEWIVAWCDEIERRLTAEADLEVAR
jgi:DNA-binding PadR family transcriptional regulator